MEVRAARLLGAAAEVNTSLLPQRTTRLPTTLPERRPEQEQRDVAEQPRQEARRFLRLSDQETRREPDQPRKINPSVNPWKQKIPSNAVFYDEISMLTSHGGESGLLVDIRV